MNRRFANVGGYWRCISRRPCRRLRLATQKDDALLAFTMLPSSGTVGQRIDVAEVITNGELPPLLPG